jgi:hypothetical protein
MPVPIDPLVAEMVEQLDLDLRLDFEERAGIVEFEAGVQRAHAEALALLNVLDRHPDALSGVTVLCVEVDKRPHYYITTDIDLAREEAERKRANEIRAAGVHWVLIEEFGGLAELVVAE